MARTTWLSHHHFFGQTTCDLNWSQNWLKDPDILYLLKKNRVLTKELLEPMNIDDTVKTPSDDALSLEESSLIPTHKDEQNNTMTFIELKKKFAFN